MDKYQEIAKQNGWGINPDKGVAEDIIAGLNHNQEVHGAPYCPCMAVRIPETKCPCVAWQNNYKRMKQCHCGLYVYE